LAGIPVTNKEKKETHPKRPHLYVGLLFRVTDQGTRDVLLLNDFPLSLIGERRSCSPKTSATPTKQTHIWTHGVHKKQTNKHSRPCPAQRAYPTDVALRQQGASRILRGVTLKTFSPQNNRVGIIPRKPRPPSQSNHIYGRMASIVINR
jgi:hypothetical protein